jgi:poly-gamma-glutamate synthesis protein (capsule biosynthesis protein)
VISANGQEWRPHAKAFHFRAHPRAVEFLKAAKIDCVTLANNHVLDYGPEALLNCLELLDRAGLKRTGAGTNVKWALEPAFAGVSGSRVGVLALTDNEPEWEASETKPGIVYVAYDRRGIREPYRTRIAEAMKRARNEADFLIVSAHMGPNWGGSVRRDSDIGP